MGDGRRRNAISYDDERLILAIAAVSGVIAAFAPADPTGEGAIDALLLMAFAVFTTWAGASAPWWALAVGAGLVTSSAVAGPIVVALAGFAALGASVWIGDRRANQPVVRAGIAAVVVQVAVRLEW